MNSKAIIIVTLTTLMASSAGYADNGDTYDASTNTLTIPRITVGSDVYTNVVIGDVARNIISVGGDSKVESLSFSTIEGSWSTNSGISTPSTVVIRDQAAWAELWAKHTGNSSPAPTLPSVDFATNMVLGVFAGSYSSGCYSLSISTVTQNNATITVEYQINTPSPVALCTANIVTLAQLIVVPKSELEISFVRTS